MALFELAFRIALIGMKVWSFVVNRASTTSEAILTIGF